MKKPIPYHPTLREAYRYRAARQATLTKLVGPNWPTDPLRYYHAMMIMRNKRLDLYCDAGREDFQRDRNLYYAKQCPLFGVDGNRPGPVCKDAMLCPCCYARTYVTAPFKRMEQFLYGTLNPRDDTGHHHRKPAEGWTAVGFRHKMNARTEDISESAVIEAADWWQKKICPRRDTELRLCQSTVGAILHQVYLQHNPRKDLPPYAYRMLRCGVLLTRQERPPILPDVEWQDSMPANKHTLCELYGRAFAFPTPVFTESPDLVLKVWRQFRKRRKFFYYPGPKNQKPVFK